MMWIQNPDREKPLAPERDSLMVNTRGRVVLVTSADARKLRGKGFRQAPKGSEAGDYIPVFDKGDSGPIQESAQAPEPVAESKASTKLKVIKVV